MVSVVPERLKMLSQRAPIGPALSILVKSAEEVPIVAEAPPPPPEPGSP